MPKDIYADFIASAPTTPSHDGPRAVGSPRILAAPFGAGHPALSQDNRFPPTPGIAEAVARLEPKPTLYTALVAAGIATDHHESDLYFFISPGSVVILADFPAQKAVAKAFISEIDGKAWFDVAFAYDPFFQAKLDAQAKGAI